MIKLFRRKSTQAPQVPQDVRLQFPDGSEQPVELVYEGRQKGLDVWVAVCPPGRMPSGLTCALLPGKTSIRIALPLDGAA